MDEEKVFGEISEKQNRTARTALFAVFCGTGALLMILALILWLTGVRDEETGVSPALILGPMGAFWMLLGAVMRLVIPKRSSYENYKKHAAGCGSVNYTNAYIEFGMQKARIAELEQRVADLERRQDILENR